MRTHEGNPLSPLRPLEPDNLGVLINYDGSHPIRVVTLLRHPHLMRVRHEFASHVD